MIKALILFSIVKTVTPGTTYDIDEESFCLFPALFNLLLLLQTGSHRTKITVLQQKKSPEGKRYFEKINSPGLEHSDGWWNSLSARDFDGDGNIDYVAGNLGLNARWKSSEEEPVRLFAKDFDGNGSIDPIMFQYLQGKCTRFLEEGHLRIRSPP